MIHKLLFGDISVWSFNIFKNRFPLTASEYNALNIVPPVSSIKCIPSVKSKNSKQNIKAKSDRKGKRSNFFGTFRRLNRLQNFERFF